MSANLSLVLLVLLSVLAYVIYSRWSTERNVRAAFAPFQNCRSATRRGYIYIFRGRGEDPRLVKIGHAKDAVGRLKAHRTANPHGIDLIAVIPAKDRIAAERFIHKLFEDHHYNGAGGSEWFVWSYKLRRFCEILNDEHRRTQYQEQLG